MTETPVQFLNQADRSPRLARQRASAARRRARGLQKPEYESLGDLIAQASVEQPGLFDDPARPAQGFSADRSPLAFAEALGLPVFLCERDGKVAAGTRQALALADDGEVLVASAGRLLAVCPMSHKLLVKALGAAAPAAASHAHPVASIIFLRSRRGLSQRADVLPAPAQRGERNQALVSIGAGPAMNEADLMAAAGLTSSEAAVARLACEGLTAPQIAWERRVSVPTIRSQLKAAHLKLGVSSRAELVALLQGTPRPGRAD